MRVRGWLLVIAYDRQILLGRLVGRMADEFIFFSYFNSDVAEREGFDSRPPRAHDFNVLATLHSTAV